MSEDTLLTNELAELARKVLAFDVAIDRLEQVAAEIGIPSPKHADWYTLLKQKLVPQILERSLMVVSVTGGTNTGKSLLFNQLTGENASGADARAAGTKQPVCLLPHSESPAVDSHKNEPPRPLPDPNVLLKRYFEHFTPVEWVDPNQPLSAAPEHRLYWRTGRGVPARLMLLDTPDIDSDVVVNWERAAMIRQTSDILIAVLTPQKYNDAAVRRFFRDAIDASKQGIVIWNMIDLDADAAMLPVWTDRFLNETGIKPLAVYVVPHDRERAAKRDLPIYVYSLADRRVHTEKTTDLGEMLAGLHFDTVKTRALLGAVRKITDPRTGAPAYLESVRGAAARFEAARASLLAMNELKVEWPDLPGAALVGEIRDWWNARRPGWSRNIHGTYRVVGNGLLWSVRKTVAFFSTAPQVDPLEQYKADEYDTVSKIVEKTINRLERLAETDNPVLRAELHALLGGENRQRLFERARAAHAELEPMSEDFRLYVRDALEKWSLENPRAISLIRSLDHVATVARPMITVSLLVGGFFGASHLLGQASVQAAEVALAGGVTAGGEAAIHAGGEGIANSAAKLLRDIRVEFARRRAKTFFEIFGRELWTATVERLEAGAKIAESDHFLAANEAIEHLG